MDPKANILAKFDDGETFKKLIMFVETLGKGISDIYLAFSKDHIKFHHHFEDQTTKMGMDVCFRIYRWKLTQYQFISTKPVYIMGLELPYFVNRVKSCKKTDFFSIYRDDSGDGIKTSKNKKESKFRREVTTEKYVNFVEPSYKTTDQNPICVATGKEFCEMCKEFSKTAYVSMIIHEQGIIVTTLEEEEGKTIGGQVRILGAEPDDISNGIKCTTSRTNLSLLSKLDEVSSRSNIRVYLDRNSAGKLLPLKLVYDIGYVGEIIIFLEVVEKK